MTKTKQEAKRAAEPTAHCELCNREKPLTEHHLIPRAVHSKKRFLRKHGKKEMQGRKLMLCKLCHKGVHELIPDEKDLAESFNTKEALLADPRILEHVKWVRKQK
jgi:hypothetical protein